MIRILFLAVFAMVLLAPANPAAAQAGSPEITFWESVRDSKNPAELETYLNTFPDGQFAPLARIRLEALKTAGAAPDRSQSQPPLRPSAANDSGERAQPVFEPPEKVVKVTLQAWPDDPARGRLGVGLTKVFEGMIAAYGAGISTGTLIESVSDGGAAQEAGIAAGSVIFSIDGASTPDPQTLVELLRKRAPGDELSIRLVELAKTPADFLQMLHRIANEGDVRAMSNLANRYRAGWGVPQDQAQAAEWYRKAADKGDVAAMRELGFKYDVGDGVPKDRARAVEWYSKAANKGDAGAMYQLGSHYQWGWGVPQEHAQAVEWYRKAAEKGDEAAMNALGDIYYEGSGIPKDHGEAVLWYRRAMEKGNSVARRNLARHYDKGLGVEKAPDLAAQYYLEAYVFADGFDSLFIESDSFFPDELSADARRAVQRRLKGAGVYHGAIDGKFGPATRQAIMVLVEKSRAPAEPQVVPQVAPDPTPGSTDTGGNVTSEVPEQLPETESLGILD